MFGTQGLLRSTLRALGVAAVLAFASTAARAETVDLELVFAADGSGSIDEDELRLQRRGWGDALTDKDVLAAIRNGVVGAIAVAYMEWGGPNSQVLIVDWHVIRDAASAEVFADKLVKSPRGATGYNSISNAIDFSVRLVERNAHDGMRKIIDVSGDGPNIGGRRWTRRAPTRSPRASPSMRSPSAAPADGRAVPTACRSRTITAASSSAGPAPSSRSPTS